MLDAIRSSGADWGVNADGWEFYIKNFSGLTLYARPAGGLDNIDYFDPTQIPPEGEGRVKGRRSEIIQGWPADCNFRHDEKEGAGPQTRSFLIRMSINIFGVPIRISVNEWAQIDVYFPEKQDDTRPQVIHVYPKGDKRFLDLSSAPRSQ
jgi:hypothetical protein